MTGDSRALRTRIRAAAWLAIGSLLVGGAQAKDDEPVGDRVDASSCDANPDLIGELVEPPGLGRSCGTDSACWERGLERARAVRDRYPTEYDAHRAYVLVARAAERFLGEMVVGKVVAEYEELAAKHPDDPAYRHLLAQLAIEGPEYRAAIDGIVEAFPSYPWAHLSRAYLGRPGTAEDLRATAVESLERFVELCPDRVVEIGRAIEIQGDAGRAEARLGPLREAALARHDIEALSGLWKLTFHFAGEAGRVSAQARIRSDLERFEAPGVPDDLGTLERLAEGHRLADDEAGSARIEARLLERHPCSEAARELRAARYSEEFAFDGGFPGADREPVAPAAMALLDRTLSACPDDLWALVRRVSALRLDPAGRIPDLVEAVDRIWAAGAQGRVGGPWPELWKAGLWLDLGIRLDRVETLLETDRRLAREAGERSSEASSARARERLRLAVRAAVASSETDRARGLLDELDQVADPEAGWRERLETERSRVALDLAEGRPDDALSRLEPWLAESPAAPGVERDARRAWILAHGDELGFAAWREAASKLATQTAGWETVDLAFPGADLVDLAGSEWRWPDPSGRVVFLRSWAGWCVSCRQELEVLRSLAEEFAGREDVAFAHLSVDRGPGDVIDYLARSELVYDVLLGGHELLGSAIERIPSSWIVNREGRIVRVQTGPAGSDPEAWLASARRALAEVAGPPPEPASSEDWLAAPDRE